MATDVIEVDALTGVVTERPFTAGEKAQRKADMDAAAAAAAALDADAQERATARAALLDRLGITDAEAALLASAL